LDLYHSFSTYTFSGEVLLSPQGLADIAHIQLTGLEQWCVCKDTLPAATQGIGKSVPSGEELFAHKNSGKGILWITGIGAIIQKNVSLSFLAN
jgi:uncharacterized protein (AIM24 family)